MSYGVGGAATEGAATEGAAVDRTTSETLGRIGVPGPASVGARLCDLPRQGQRWP